MKVKMKSAISALLACLFLMLILSGCASEADMLTEFDKGNRKVAEMLKTVKADDANLPKSLTVYSLEENKQGKANLTFITSIDDVKHEYYNELSSDDDNTVLQYFTFVTGEGDDCRVISAMQTYNKTDDTYSGRRYRVLFAGTENDVTRKWSDFLIEDMDNYTYEAVEHTYLQMAVSPKEYAFEYHDDGAFDIIHTTTDEDGKTEQSTTTYRDALCASVVFEDDESVCTDTYKWNERAEYTLPTLDETWEKFSGDVEEENLIEGKKALADILNAVDMMYGDLPLKLTVQETGNSTSGGYASTELYDAVNFTYVREMKSAGDDEVTRSFTYVAPYEKQYAVINAKEVITVSTGKPVSRTYEVEFVGAKSRAISYFAEMHSNRTIFSVMDDGVRFLLIDVEMNPDDYRFEFRGDKLDVITEWTNDDGDKYYEKMTFNGNFYETCESTYRTANNESKNTAVFTWNQLLTEYTLPTFDETWVREKSPVTMAQLREANQLNALLENHENLSYSLTGVMKGSFSMEAFSTKELFFGNYNGSEQILTKDWGCIREDGVLYPAVSLESEQEIIENDLQGQLLNVRVTTEEVTGQYTENGVLIITTEMSEADSKYLFNFLVSGGTFSEESIIRMRYETDPETLRIIKTTMYLVDKDDNKTEIFHLDNIKYDVKAPAAVAECQTEYFRIQNATKGIRTLTIIKDPGTVNEVIIKVKALLGTRISVALSADYPKLYLDAACTQVFAGNMDTMKDATLYSKSVK